MQPQDPNNPQNVVQPGTVPPVSGGVPPQPQPSVVSPQGQQTNTIPQQPQFSQPVAPMGTPTPAFQPQPQSGGSGIKKIGIIAAIAVVLVAGGVFAATTLLGGNKSDDTTTNSNSRGSGDTVDPQETLKNQDVSAGFNEKVALSNGVGLTVTGIEPNWAATKAGRTAPRPKDGTSHVAVNIIIENNTAEPLRVGGTDFTLFDQGGESYIEGLTTYQADEQVLTLGEIPAGGSKTGQIIYTNVPNGRSLSFVYEEKYRNSGTGEELSVKATFK